MLQTMNYEIDFADFLKWVHLVFNAPSRRIRRARARAKLKTLLYSTTFSWTSWSGSDGISACVRSILSFKHVVEGWGER